MEILISDIFVTATSSGKCKSLLKTNCGGGVKAPSCHFCYSKYGTRRCGGDCEYNPYIGRCEKSKCLVLSRKKSKYRHPKITERHVKMIKITKLVFEK